LLEKYAWNNNLNSPVPFRVDSREDIQATTRASSQLLQAFKPVRYVGLLPLEIVI
jgi:hypothetical protein